MKRHLPRRVYEKHGSFWYVDLDRKWHKLCRINLGLPTMYRELARLSEREADSDRMPAVIARWADSKRPSWAVATERNMDRAVRVLGDAFAEFAPAQVTTPICSQFLKTYAAKPRTHNIYRNVLGQVLAFAAVEGLREDHNPIKNIPGKETRGRNRIVTDAEVITIKAAALKAARNGEALVQMIDLAMLTGQRIGDLIGLRWQDVTDSGLIVQQGKTGERLLIGWSPALRAAIAACDRGQRIGHVLKTQTGGPYRYAGIRSAWDRACGRAGVLDLNIHDLRGRAGVDSLLAHGIVSAQEMLGHKGEAMTRHYTDGKYHKLVKPAG